MREVFLDRLPLITLGLIGGLIAWSAWCWGDGDPVASTAAAHRPIPGWREDLRPVQRNDDTIVYLPGMQPSPQTPGVRWGDIKDRPELWDKPYDPATSPPLYWPGDQPEGSPGFIGPPVKHQRPAPSQ